jgi:MFS family permease
MTNTETSAGADAEAYISWREFLTSSYAPSLILVCLAVLLHAADSLIVATMLPSIVADINGASLVGLTVSMYEIGSIVAGAASAILSLRYGLNRPMSIAAVVFGIGCLLSAFSLNMPQFLIGRSLQGLGGGGLVAMSFIAVGTLFPRRYTARALATISTVWGVSAFLGPLIGGFFVEFATWRWGFIFFAGIAFSLALWIFFRTHTKMATSDEPGVKFPFRRLGLLCLAVLLVAAAGVKINIIQTSAFILAGLSCLVLFLKLDGNAIKNRLLPVRPFDLTKPTGAALVMILSLAIASVAIGAFGPLLITAIHNASALTVGYIITCSSVGWTIMAIVVSGLPERLDRNMIAIGMITVFLSILGFLYAVPHGPLWLIAVFAFMEGAGFGMAWTFILRRATASAEPQEVERISGAIPTVQRLGYALGAAYIGIVANASGILTMQTPKDAMNVAFWVFFSCLPFAVLGLVSMYALTRSRPTGVPGKV